MHVFITGSTQGLGYHMALEFLRRGHEVTINGRFEASVKKALDQFKDAGFKDVNGLVFDVSNYEAFERSTKELGAVHLWINNAGVYQWPEPLEDHTWEIIDQVFDVNLKGAVYGTKLAISRMEDHRGGIYNVEGFGSDGRMQALMTLYGTSKYAIRYFTRSLAKESKRQDLIIGLLNPGIVQTDFLKSTYPKDQEIRQKYERFYRRFASPPQTVAKVLVHGILANRKNSKTIKYLTGVRFLKKLIF